MIPGEVARQKENVRLRKGPDWSTEEVEETCTVATEDVSTTSIAMDDPTTIQAVLGQGDDDDNDAGDNDLQQGCKTDERGCFLDFETQSAAIARRRERDGKGGRGGVVVSNKLKERVALFGGGSNSNTSKNGNIGSDPISFSDHVVTGARGVTAFRSPSTFKKSKRPQLRRINSTGSVDTDDEGEVLLASGNPPVRKFRRSGNKEAESSKEEEDDTEESFHDDNDDGGNQEEADKASMASMVQGSTTGRNIHRQMLTYSTNSVDSELVNANDDDSDDEENLEKDKGQIKEKKESEHKPASKTVESDVLLASETKKFGSDLRRAVDDSVVDYSSDDGSVDRITVKRTKPRRGACRRHSGGNNHSNEESGEDEGNNTEDEYVPGGGFRGTFMDFDAQERAIRRRRENKNKSHEKVGSIRNLFEKPKAAEPAPSSPQEPNKHDKVGSMRNLFEKPKATAAPAPASPPYPVKGNNKHEKVGSRRNLFEKPEAAAAPAPSVFQGHGHTTQQEKVGSRRNLFEQKAAVAATPTEPVVKHSPPRFNKKGSSPNETAHNDEPSIDHPESKKEKKSSQKKEKYGGEVSSQGKGSSKDLKDKSESGFSRSLGKQEESVPVSDHHHHHHHHQKTKNPSKSSSGESSGKRRSERGERRAVDDSLVDYSSDDGSADEMVVVVAKEHKRRGARRRNSSSSGADKTTRVNNKNVDNDGKSDGGSDTEEEYVPGGGYRGTFMDWDAQQRAIARRRTNKETGNEKVGSVRKLFEHTKGGSTPVADSGSSTQQHHMGDMVGSVRNLFERPSSQQSQQDSVDAEQKLYMTRDKVGSVRYMFEKNKPQVTSPPTEPHHTGSNPARFCSSERVGSIRNLFESKASSSNAAAPLLSSTKASSKSAASKKEGSPLGGVRGASFVDSTDDDEDDLLAPPPSKIGFYDD